jgi:hypothetical protein
MAGLVASGKNFGGSRFPSTDIYLKLFSFSKQRTLNFKKVKETVHPHSLFNLPVSAMAFQQFNELQLLMDQIILSDNTDHWTHIWGSSIFSSSKAYKALIGHATTPAVFS